MSRTAKIDMIGKRYGKLSIVSELVDRNKNGHIMYSCICDCGKIKEILGVSIRSGMTTSCGCAQRDSVLKHGMDGTPEYRAWISMKNRCTSNKSANYKNYGGRGISVCNEWMDFNAFINDMGLRPSASHSIDRIDNNKGYSKGNCRWSTKKEQAQNRRSSVIVRFNGEDMFMDRFAKIIGLTESGARKRVNREFVKINGVFIKESDLK